MIYVMNSQQNSPTSENSQDKLSTDKLILVGPIRQLLAMFYDAWLLAAVFIAASAVTLPFTQGEPVRPGNPFMTTYIFIVWYGFYAWFWTHGGQTLGMRSWKIKLTTNDAKPLTLWHTLLRFISGIPAWLLIGMGGYLMFANNPNLQHPLMNVFAKLPLGLVFGVGCVLLLSGHLKTSWRNNFSSTHIICVKTKQSKN